MYYKKGDLRSRPISELENIWNELLISAAVHVEGVLFGSGTSRNQPETILANLPYIEWLKYGNKKHISYVESNTHPFGTLKKMDDLDAIEISKKLSSKASVNYPNFYIVTNDITEALNDLQTKYNGTVETINSGVYDFISNNLLIRIINSNLSELDCGCYPYIDHQSNCISKSFIVGGERLYSVSISGLICLFK